MEGNQGQNCNCTGDYPNGGHGAAEEDRLMSVVLEAVHALIPRAKPSPYAKRWWASELTQLRRICTYWRNRVRAERRAGRPATEHGQRSSKAVPRRHQAAEKDALERVPGGQRQYLESS